MKRIFNQPDNSTERMPEGALPLRFKAHRQRLFDLSEAMLIRIDNVLSEGAHNAGSVAIQATETSISKEVSPPELSSDSAITDLSARAAEVAHSIEESIHDFEKDT